MSRNQIIDVLNKLDPALVEECAEYRLPSERNGMKKLNKRRMTAMILAACLVVALAVTAYATGAIQSLIGKYWSQYSYTTPDDALREERPDYAAWLDEQLETQSMMLAVGEKSVQTRVDYPIPSLKGAGVTLLEYYYDGEKIALACQFHAPEQPVDFDFDPSAYPNLPFEALKPGGYPDYRSMVKDETSLRAIEERLQKQGRVSFLVYESHMSDGVYAEGENLAPCGDLDENGIFTVDPIATGLNGGLIPEKCRNLEEITVSLTYRVSVYAYQLEADTVQYAAVGRMDFPVSFTVPNLDPASIPAKWSPESDFTESIDVTQRVRGTSLTIHAPVPAVSEQQFHSLGNVTMESDVQLWEKMGRELLVERYPQLEAELSSGNTDIFLSAPEPYRPLLCFSCSATGVGRLYYDDYLRDLGGRNLDEAETHGLPHYLTSIVPDGMDMTGEEAAQTVAELLSNYSCFQFTPWNVQANFDSEKQQGYYYILLQPEYQGIPVYETIPNAYYSNQGLFASQGLMMLKETGWEPLSSSLSLEQAVASVVNNIPEASFCDSIQCDIVRLGYVKQEQEGAVTLTPAWVFECSGTQSGQEYIHYFNIYVSLETGKLGYIYNMDLVWMDPA